MELLAHLKNGLGFSRYHNGSGQSIPKSMTLNDDSLTDNMSYSLGPSHISGRVVGGTTMVQPTKMVIMNKGTPFLFC
jgi:hypothetical protein